jgi:hypothetical protein
MNPRTLSTLERSVMQLPVELRQSFGQWLQQTSRTQRERGAGQHGFIYCKGTQCPRFKPRCVTIGRQKAGPVYEGAI